MVVIRNIEWLEGGVFQFYVLVAFVVVLSVWFSASTEGMHSGIIDY